MMRKVSIHILRAVLTAGIVLGVLGVALRPLDFAQDRPRSGQALRPRSGQALAATGNIDPVDKWAWGTNVGWINFRPEHGGVTVYSDHLEGYAWGENIGWIRLGSYTGGGSHTYGNTSNTDYGVNRDGSGNLSGYAWGTSVGWINFSPTHGGVTIDPVTGSFDGYAWAENVGWIRFGNPEARVNKWGWSNAGWINLNPTHGGVTVYPDHLEGTAWGENIGWIRLGTHTGGGTYTYGNTSAADYGVNNDGTGNLSGFAWSTNAGWINFRPTHGGVTVDPATGSFAGYAWAENVGWIHFTRPDVYNVAVVEGAGDIYLPIILKGYVPPVPPPAAPDLVVDSLVATSTAVTVSIRNAGTTAVNDEFWVDVYVNPRMRPSLNQPWDTIADYGVVWGVTDPIPAGGSLTLTSGGAYYFPEYSSTPPLPVGAEVWALVDSVDYSTTYGAVRESNEGNNLYGPVTSTAATVEAAPVFRQSQPASREGLPPR